MSNLSSMEKLLNGFEVEWKELGSVAEIKRGTSITKKNVIHGDVPVIAGGRTPAYYHNVSNREGQTIVIAGSGAYAGFVSWWEQPIFVSDAFTVKPTSTLMTRYCYHFLMNMQQQLHDFKSGGGVPHVYPRDVSPIKIPIPCPDNPEKSLAIQAEIVRILDAFTAMTAELTAELNLRKKQYNYYREKLLASELPSSKKATLGEVLDMRAGRHIKAKDISAIKNTEHKYICFGGNGSRGFVQAYSHDGDYALIGRQGALCGNIKRATGKFYATEHAVVCTPKEEIDIDWIFHMLTFMNLNQYKSQSAQPGLAVGNLANLAINVPPISVQKKIAKILNKFDMLTTSLQEGLPREIELRQKQYEYYRDLLLSFPKSEEAA
ncbi:restriction endonuclease subunit S [Vibrio cholerae]|uniref:restriction endonuclease subunit S n=1 Tax=Vibrio cholerae TaxID=666 RepID=UPI000E6C8769|nr:restriction endonuclease subunit S [Vibrio cholerae]RJK82741.1 restriction endonuclease [Vibrio cholerae]